MAERVLALPEQEAVVLQDREQVVLQDQDLAALQDQDLGYTWRSRQTRSEQTLSVFYNQYIFLKPL